MKIAIMNIVLSLVFGICVLTGRASSVEHSRVTRDIAFDRLSQILMNGSIIHANHLAATFSGTSRMQWFCTNFDSLDAHWRSAFGLPSPSTDAKDVVCDPPTIEAAIGALASPLTRMFYSEVVTAGTSGTIYLADMCTLMEEDIIRFYGVSVKEFFKLICADAGAKHTFGISGGLVLTESASASIKRYKSQIFARMMVISATDVSQIRSLCTDFPSFQAAITKQGLNSSEVQINLCDNVETLLAPSDARAYLLEPMGNLFEVMLLNAGPVKSAYTQSLCSNLDVDAMEDLGFDGNRIVTNACALNSASLARRRGPNPCLTCSFDYGIL